MNSQLSVQLTGTADPDSGVGDWVIIEQEAIPEEQQIATAQDFEAGIRQLESGQSAHTAFTGLCPFYYKIKDGKTVVCYTVVFYVHRAAAVTPEIEVTIGGDLLAFNGPEPGIIPQAKSWIFRDNKTQQLGWRASSAGVQTKWEIAFSNGRITSNPLNLPDVDYADGFIYLVGDPVTGSLRVTGKAVVDVYTAEVAVAAGTKWRGDLYATAWWPAGAARDDQQRVTEELFLPNCVVEKIEDCGGAGGGGGDVVVNPPVYLDVDKCSGKVLGETPNT